MSPPSLSPLQWRPLWSALLLLIGLCQLPLAQAAERIAADHVVIQWLAPDAFAAGNTTLGIHFQPDPGWHVYWRNPGDSGAAPRFAFTADNAEVGAARWPYPARLPIAHLVNLGYEKDVAYLFEATVFDASASGGDQVRIEADLEWLVCKEECIPGFGLLTLQRPVADAARWSADAKARLDHFQARVPGAAEQSPWKIVSAQWRRSDSVLSVVLEPRVDGIAVADVAAPDAFPLDGNFVNPHVPSVQRTKNGFEYRFVTAAGIDAPASTGFVIVTDGVAAEFTDIAVTQGAPIQAQSTNASFWILLLSALAGGVILNLMPCVLPVLSIKLFGLIRAPANQRVREATLYTLGVLATFFALGAIFLALRAGGAAIGWGFQLQSPLVVLFLIVLFWLLALAFLGSIETGHRLMQWAGASQHSSSFTTGVLAVFVAAPCTGPFMGAALGAAATLPAMQAMAIFLGLGCGLALPFLVLTLIPALSSRLPKPGPWMERLRQFFAFPLFATVLWLTWVLAQLSGEEAWLVSGGLLLVLAFALWLARAGTAWKSVAWVIAIVAIAGGGYSLQHSVEAPHAVAGASAWSAFDAKKIADARAQKKPVFVDFTAAWCITCQVNKKAVLDTDAADAIFSQHDVLRVRADWTRYDPAITDALAAFGRNSVPVYVFYPADGSEPKLLPQVLTLDMIRQLFP